MNDRSSVLIDTIGIKEVKLPAKRKASGPVFRDEIVEDPIAFALIEALIAQHRYDHVLKFLEFSLLAFIDRSADEPVQRHPREIIPLRPPGTPVRITKRLLPLPCRLYIHHSPSHLGLLNGQGTGPPAQAPFGGIGNIETGIGSSQL